MTSIDVHWHPSQRELRVFACSGGVFFGIVAWIVAERFGSPMVAMAILVVSAAVAIVGLLVPAVILPVYWAWMIAAYPMNWLVSHVVMAVVYFLVITPVGLIMRACGRDPLQRRFDREARSYWKPRARESKTSRYFRQY